MAENTDGSQWRPLATLNDVPSGEMSSHDVGDIHIALYNIDGTIFATDNVCTHAYALLTDGWLDNNIIECPLHGARFHIPTGKCTQEPGGRDLICYAVKREGERLLVKVD